MAGQIAGEIHAAFARISAVAEARPDRGENDVNNRILPCRPCNGRKSVRLTMRGLIAGLIDENREAGWTKDEKLASRARDLAQERYRDTRYRRRWPAAIGDLFDWGRKP